jgi:hypothetical protein
VQYAQTIWYALLSILHGGRLVFDTDCSTPDAIILVANVLEYCEYLGVAESIVVMLHDCVLDIPGICYSVEVNPCAYLQLGWDLQLPVLYLDAARHIIGRVPLAQLEDGRFPFDPNCDLEASWSFFEQEMMVLLHAGARAQVQEQLRLIREMMEVLSPERDSLSIPKTHAMLPSRPRMRECVAEAKSLLRSQIAFISKKARDQEKEHECLNLRRYFVSLLRFLRNQSDGALQRKFRVKDVAAIHHFYVPHLRLALVKFMLALECCILDSPLFKDANHLYTEHDPYTHGGQVQEGLHDARCQRCCRANSSEDAEYEGNFAWLDPKTLFPVWMDKPWPLNEMVCRHENAKPSTEVCPPAASDKWIVAIGLGDIVDPKKNIDQRQPPRLSLDMNCSDFPGSALATLFGEQETDFGNGNTSADEDDPLPLTPNYATAAEYSDRLAEQLGDRDDLQLPRRFINKPSPGIEKWLDSSPSCTCKMPEERTQIPIRPINFTRMQLSDFVPGKGHPEESEEGDDSEGDSE